MKKTEVNIFDRVMLYISDEKIGNIICNSFKLGKFIVELENDCNIYDVTIYRDVFMMYCVVRES